MKMPKYLTLPDEAKPFFKAIIAVKPEDKWTQPDIAKAVNLARAQADIERISQELEVEGDTLINARGTEIVNPKHALLETLTRRELALSRAIHVHAEATSGRARDSLGAKGRKAVAAKKATKKFAPLDAPGLKVVG